MRKIILLTISVAMAISCFGVWDTTIQAKKPLQTMSLSNLRQLVMSKKIDEYTNSLNSTQRVLSGVGVKKVLVLPCFFDDVRYTYTKESIEAKFVRGKEKSLSGYYWDASGGQMDIQFGSKGIPDWIRMPKKYEVYGTMEELIEDGLKEAVKLGYDLSEYDFDGNGQPDVAVFVWAGNSWTVGGPMPGDFTFSPENFGRYISIGEDVRMGFPMITIIHEYAHAEIPLWDMYDYSYTSSPVGGWDLMADGVWADFCGLSAYHRWKSGWIEPITITEPGTYYIDDLNGDGPNKMYKIPIPGSNEEWLCIENRSRKGCDGYYQGAPDSGFVIYHVDDAREYRHWFNTLGTVYGQKWKTHGIMVLDPSGSTYHKGAVYGADVSRTKITPNTTPNTLPYRKNNSDKNIHITEISARGPRMSFKVEFLAPEKPIVSVDPQVFFGKIVKGKTATKEVIFKNAGIGKLFIQMKPSENWMTLDRPNFIGNDEPVNISIDTTTLKIGKYTAKVNYANQSSDATGYIECIFEVVPIEGDIDANGKVEKVEIEEFMKFYGLHAEDNDFDSKYDFNSDGVIDLIDLMLLAKNFKQD
jgi:M6 family metalloprotease-like protein